MKDPLFRLKTVKPSKNLFQDDALVELYVYNHDMSKFRVSEENGNFLLLKFYIYFSFEKVEHTFAHVPFFIPKLQLILVYKIYSLGNGQLRALHFLNQ